MTSDGLAGFGVLLRRRRLEAGLSQEELAGRAAVSARAISNLERGSTTKPYLRTVVLLADALGLPESGRDELLTAARDGHQPGPAAVTPRQLPATVSGFTGRARELEWLSGRADADPGAGGTAVISAIGGTAGVGKTALAVHWAHQVIARFPDGQLFVNLRGYDPGQPMSPADALAGLLRALGVPGQDIPAETEERAARYRSLLAGRRMLVLLDNARSVEQVRPLMAGVPGCLTLVTSRDSLAGLVARDGAQRLDVDLLPAADAVELLERLIGDRATADPATTRTLAGQCAHLPLALRVAAELAAARPGAPLASLAGELADQQRRLDLLDAGGDPRTAVRAVFSWSGQHLAPATARVFRLAGLHPGADFDSYAVAALTGLPVSEARHELRLLARAYLVQSIGPDRYGQHDLLRDYARELVGTHDGAGAERAALTRLFDYYLYTAARGMDVLFPAERSHRPDVARSATVAPSPAGPAEALAWLDSERASLVAAVVHAADHGWPEHAIRLASTLYSYLETGRHAPEAIALHGHVQRAARQIGDRGGEAAALTSLGVINLGQGLYSRSIDHCQQAWDICREIGDRSGAARAVLNLAVAEQALGDDSQAVGHFEQALALSSEVDDRVGEGRALTGIANAELVRGNHQRGAACARAGLAISRETGDRRCEVLALCCLGFLARRQGDYQQAAGYMRQTLVLFADTGYWFAQAQALTTLAVVERLQGHYQEAAGHLLRVLALCREMGDRSGEAGTLTRLGVIDVLTGHHRRGIERHLQALARFHETADRGRIMALSNLGEAFLAEGHPGQAHTRYAAALDLAKAAGDVFEQARAHDGLGRVHAAAGDSGQAQHHWEQALTRYAELGVPEVGQVRARLAGSGVSSNETEPTARS